MHFYIYIYIYTLDKDCTDNTMNNVVSLLIVYENWIIVVYLAERKLAYTQTTPD